MRRVNFRNGLKQRLNELLGTDYLTEGDVPGITFWSLQSAMLSNLRRIVSAFGALGFGRPVNGLTVSQNGPTGISIRSGTGFTNNGDVIVVPNHISVIITDLSDGDKYIYLAHKMGTLDGDTNPSGKKTGFIGRLGTEDIVYDDMASTVDTLSQPIVDQIIVQNTTPPPFDSDHIYLATVTIATGTIVAIINTPYQGLGPSGPNSNFILYRLLAKGPSVFEDSVEFQGDVTFSGAGNVASAMTFTEKIIVSEIEASGIVDMNGIFVIKDELRIPNVLKLQNPSITTLESGATLELIAGCNLIARGQAVITTSVTVRDSAGTGQVRLDFSEGLLYQIVNL